MASSIHGDPRLRAGSHDRVRWLQALWQTGRYWPLLAALPIIGSYFLVVNTAVAVTRSALPKAVAEGYKLFTGNGFFSANMIHGKPVTCATCHLHGGMTRGRLADRRSIPSLVNALAIFPRYSPKEHKVITLQTQIRICVNAGLAGIPPAYGGRNMTAMISYLGSLAYRQPVNIGGNKH